MKKNFTGSCSILSLGLFPILCSAASFTDITASITHNDNISYGTYSEDILGDTLACLKVGYGIPVPVGDYGTLTTMFKGSVDAYSEYSDLNSAIAEAGLYYKSKFGVGASVPWYQFGVTAGYRTVADDLRDGTLMGASASLGKSFSEQLTSSINLGYTSTSADNATFDTDMQSIGVNGDYLLTEDWLLFASYTRYSGDIVATTLPNSYIIQQSDAIVADPAYGPGRYAYRLDADTDVAKVGANYYLSENSSLELVYMRRDSDVGLNTDYTSNIYTINYLYGF